MSLAQERICVERYLSDGHKYLSDIKDHPNYHRLRAVFINKKIWPSGSKIRIAFKSNGNNVPRTPLNEMLASGRPVDPLQYKIGDMNPKEAVKKIVNERFVPILDLDIQFIENYTDANVRITFDSNGGAWSLVGTDCAKAPVTEATMNLGWFDVGTVLHEFGHTFGMVHEQNNPRGETIQWNVPKVLEWAKQTQGWDEKTTRANILMKYRIDQTNGSEFDANSIMLYFFPNDLTLNNRGTHQNFRLSRDDVIYLNRNYPDSTETPSAFYSSVYGEDISSRRSGLDWYLLAAIACLIILIIILFVIKINGRF